MSPLALLLKGLGHAVSGSDMKASAVTQQLTNAGVTVTIGHEATLIHGVDVVVYSTAIPNDNVELVAARNEGIAVRHRSDLLASLCRSLESVGVAGTHGKTTTSCWVVITLRS
jgi:UDP-N-acetylmuramate--alanine ligase